jgi:predicted  nucleic acid-binding Zn-ribbon protein
MGNKVVVQEKPVREQIREQKRAIERSVRNIEREKRRVEGEEKKIKGEIKKMAKAGQHVSEKLTHVESCENAGEGYRENEGHN